MTDREAVDELELLPGPTADELAPLVRRFVRERLSGYVEVRLHFLEGRPMPSDVGTHLRGVGRGLTRKGGP